MRKIQSKDFPKDLQEVTNMQQLQQMRNSSQMIVPIAIKPLSLVRESLKPNDHVVVCNLESDEIWLKFKIAMRYGNAGNKARTLESELELKIDKSITGQAFQAVSQKLSIYLFNQHGLSVKSVGTYVLTDFKVFKTEKAAP